MGRRGAWNRTRIGRRGRGTGLGMVGGCGPRPTPSTASSASPDRCPASPSPASLVREFHLAFGLDARSTPAEVSPALAAHRGELLAEEAAEVAEVSVWARWTGWRTSWPTSCTSHRHRARPRHRPRRGDRRGPPLQHDEAGPRRPRRPPGRRQGPQGGALPGAGRVGGAAGGRGGGAGRGSTLLLDRPGSVPDGSLLSCLTLRLRAVPVAPSGCATGPRRSGRPNRAVSRSASGWV